jgi:Chaperone of endosialidase
VHTENEKPFFGPIPLLTYFSASHFSQAVSPPPDGDYPGAYNTAVSWFSLQSNLTGNFNTAIGAGTLFANTADANTATGVGALLNNTIGENNTAGGVFALFDNTTGDSNTATGLSALGDNTTGSFNTAGGANALLSNTTGGGNTAIGNGALFKNTTGDSNTALGISAGSDVTTGTNVICIGSDGANVNNSCFIGNIHGVTTAINDAIPVVIDSAGQLGTMSSSYRFNKDISAMEKSSEAILSLRPVTFHYKTDTKGTPQFGLIAEKVAKVNPNLVVRDKKDEIYTVRYDAVNAMLLNEFLKEHRKIQELEATVAKQQKDFQATATQQQKQIEALTAGLQKVSRQLEASKPAPQTVANK